MDAWLAAGRRGVQHGVGIYDGPRADLDIRDARGVAANHWAMALILWACIGMIVGVYGLCT
jgi:hypothetical protein